MNSDADKRGSKFHRTDIIVALIALVGALGAAAIANWEKLFPRDSRGPATVVSPANTSPTTSPTTVLRSERDRIVGYRLISEGPGLIVFEVDYTYDPAHARDMYVSVTVYSDAEPAESGQKAPRKQIAKGVSERLTRPEGSIRVDARKLLGQPTESEFIEITLLEEAVSVTVVQYPYRRRWGPA
jgi:hypothetical protein